jgi:hypothetical protein
MSAFLAAVLSFPTVIFTVALAFFVLYAVLTLLGAADIEWLDGMFGIDEVSDTPLENVLDALGIAGIPITVFAGMVSLFAWVASYLGDRFLPDTTAIDSGIGISAFAIGIGLGALAARPFKPLFIEPQAQRRSELVGKVCTIRSLHVNGETGVADLGDIVAEVRCFRDNQLTVGSPAIVYDYDAVIGTYHVGPLDPTVARTEIV